MLWCVLCASLSNFLPSKHIRFAYVKHTFLYVAYIVRCLLGRVWRRFRISCHSVRVNLLFMKIDWADCKVWGKLYSTRTVTDDTPNNLNISASIAREKYSSRRHKHMEIKSPQFVELDSCKEISEIEWLIVFEISGRECVSRERYEKSEFLLESGLIASEFCEFGDILCSIDYIPSISEQYQFCINGCN